MADIEPGSCPYCGIINRETEVIEGEDRNEPGTLLICETCAGLSIYLGHGAARKPDEYERHPDGRPRRDRSGVRRADGVDVTSYPAYVPEHKREAWDRLDEASMKRIYDTLMATGQAGT